VRRIVSMSLLSLITVLGAVVPVRATGLYVGDGRRSLPSWSARFNLSGGFHGAHDPLEDDGYSYGRWYAFGGYGSAGLEVHSGYGNSIEVYGLYRSIDDADVSYRYPYESRVRDRFEIDAWSFGATLRHYEFRGTSGAYVGLGGGFVQADAHLRQAVSGTSPFDLDTSDDGGELHALFGVEGRFARGVMVGLELGYRHAFLQSPADFSGAILGLRMSLLRSAR
jgi:hypothetical protein